MKTLRMISAMALAGLLFALALSGCSKKEPVLEGKTYPLDTCLVCGMKLSMMGEPYTFVYQGQQIKVCGASEKVEFDKDPAKYMKKIAEAEVEVKK